ncbi:hypothetical protein P3370_23900, partial [Vibrio parahaemolyticus]|nr:hypothetical protein [Vibrio parahaemolyticus]
LCYTHTSTHLRMLCPCRNLCLFVVFPLLPFLFLLILGSFKGTKSKIYIFLLPVVLFINLDCFGVSVTDRGVCLLLNITELDGTPLVLLKVPKNTFEKLKSSVSRNRDLVTQDNPQTLL